MLCILQGRTLRMVPTAGIYLNGLTLTSGYMGSELHNTVGFDICVRELFMYEEKKKRFSPPYTLVFNRNTSPPTSTPLSQNSFTFPSKTPAAYLLYQPSLSSMFLYPRGT